MKQLLDSLVPQGLADDLAALIIEHTLKEVDKDDDGYLNYDEFRHAVAHTDITAKMTLSF